MTHSKLKKLKKPRSRRDVTYTYVYHIATWTLIVVTLLFTAFRFRAVFVRTFEALIDLATSLIFFVLEGFDGTKGLVKPTVTTISDGMRGVFPLSYENFLEGLRESFFIFRDRDNFLDFLIHVLNVLMWVLNFVLLVGLPLFVYGLFLRFKAKKQGKPKGVQKKSAFYAFLKRADDGFFGKITYFFRRWERQFFRRFPRYKLCIVLCWVFNLNFFTLFIELVAYSLYFLRSLDIASLPIMLYKICGDLYVATSFLPTVFEIWLAYRVFHELRYAYGESRLRKFIKKIEKVIEDTLGTIFVVGKQRSRKTTLITVLGLIKAAMYRKMAKASMNKRRKQFPNFPWRRIEKTIARARKRHTIYTLATARKFIKDLRALYYNPLAKNPTWRKIKTKELRHTYGYCGNDFLFGYRKDKYAMKYNDGRAIVNIFSALEAYARLYFIYSTPTPLIFSNYAVRTDEIKRSKGHFELYDLDFINRKPEDIPQISQYSHIGDKDALRLGKLMQDDNPNACAVEFGVWLEMEWAKEIGNQKTTEGQKKDDNACNQKNDGHAEMLKTITHLATVDNKTYFGTFVDDHREDSAGADYKQLTTTWRIKETSESKTILPFFELERLFDTIFSGIYDFFDEKITFLYGENAFLFIFKKIFLPFDRYCERLSKKFDVYSNLINMKDGADDETIKDHGKLSIPEYLAFSGRFATDGLGEFFYERALKSQRGINDVRQFAGGRMTFDEMLYVKGHFYTRLGELMNLAAFVEAKRKRDEWLKERLEAEKAAKKATKAS